MFSQQKSGFGSSGFGSAGGGSLFGNKSSTTAGGLFGSTGNTGGFGSTSNAGGGFGSFGSNTGSIFGTPATKTGTGLFGTPSQGFGTSTQSTFGASSFGQTQPGGLFGTSTPASTATAFGGGGGGLFGGGSSFGNQPSGTGSVKFTPVSGTDTMMKNGLQQNISTKHQCITAMKQYEGKSFEELRVDDYLAGRKGQAGGSAFGTSSSSTGQTGFSFGQKSTAGGLFGSTAKPAFNTAPGGSLFGNTSTSSSGGGLFGTSKPFGAATAASTGFSFGGTSTGSSLFGSSAAKPAFGATSTSTGGGLFGNSGGSAFGTSTGFGGGSSLFGNKATTGFGATQTNTGFGNTGGNLFGQSAKPAGSLFGTSTGFGQQNTGGSLFGGGKPAFGGTSTANTGGLFGNTLNTSTGQNKGLFGGFGTGSSLGGGSAFNFNSGTSTLGGTGSTGFGGGTSGFGGGLFGQQATTGAANMGAVTLPVGSNQQSSRVLQALLATPFGDSPLFRNNLSDSSKRQEMLKPTNPIAQQAALQSPVYRGTPGSKMKIKPKARSNVSPKSATSHGKPHQLFAGLEPDDESTAVSNRSFVGRSSVKRLTIKLAPNSASYPGTPRRLSASSSTHGSSKSAGASQAEETFEDNVIQKTLSGKLHLSAVDTQESFRELASEPTQQASKELYKSSTSATFQRSETGIKVPSSNAILAKQSQASNHSSASGKAASKPTLAPQTSSSYQFAKPLEKQTPTPEGPRASETQADRPTLFNDTMSDLNIHLSAKNDSTSAVNIPLGNSISVPALTSDTTDQIPAEPHPAGIVLSRAGYYTIPNMEQLATMIDENKRCKITDFTVGRLGYGSVFFPGEVDVTDMNLDEIVYIRRKEVTIYPEDDKKPPVGEGLNRPAEVTLDCVWPADKTTREPVSDPERLAQMKWADKLEQTTVKMGARFLEYRPNTGSWAFEVNHFSKYGLPESDDEEPVDLDQPREARPNVGLQKLPLKKSTLWSTKTQVKVTEDLAKRKDGLGGEDVCVGDAKRGDPAFQGAVADLEEEMQDVATEEIPPVQDLLPFSHKVAYEMGVKPQRLQTMKASFFADEDEQVASTNVEMTSLLAGQRVERIANVLGSPNVFLEPDPARASSPIMLSQKKVLPEGKKPVKKTRFLDATTKIFPAMSRTSLEESNNSILSSTRQRSVFGSPVGVPRSKMPVVSAPKRSPVIIPPSSELDRENLLCDAACFLGRSFRVGWGPGWQLSHSGNAIGSSLDGGKQNESFNIFSSQKYSIQDTFSVQLERARSAPHLTGAPKAVGEMDDLPYLDLAWKFTDVGVGKPPTDDVTFAQSTSVVSVADSYLIDPMRRCAPMLKPQEGVAALKAYAEAAEQAWNLIDPTHPDSGFTLACHVVFSLCDTLWGKLENFSENASEYAVQMRRKQMVVSWLTKSIEAELSVGRKHSLPETESMEKIFRHVSEGKIDLAVKCAVETSNTHLATVLASSCSASANPVAVTKQLVEWIETEADTFVSNSALKLYCLLAAKPTWLSCQGIINTCEGLDWKRSLLFHLTFLTEPVSLISDGVLKYEAAWKGKSEFQVYSAAPVPAYVERSREKVVVNPDERDECPLRDMCYHLIKLYCKRSHRLDTTLSPSSVVPHPLDYRVSWHVWRLLYSAGYGSGMKSTTIASLHFSYAAQLESRGLWHQAVFVLMHLDNSRRREMAIRSLLGRYVFSDAERNQEQESFMVDELGVPEVWLHECRALHAKTCKADHKVAYYLLKANHWQSAHNALMKGVVADSLIHDRYDYLDDLLSAFVEANATGCVKNWDVAGKVYLDFLTLTKHIKSVEQNITTAREIESELEEIWPRVSTLCKQVADLKCNSAKDRLARAEIAQQTLNLYNMMNLMLKQHELSSPYEKTSQFSTVPSSVVALQTTKMCLPEDYAIQDLARIVENHFIELKTIKKHEL